MIQNLEAFGFPTVARAESKDHLADLLRTEYRGLIVTLIHKFHGIDKNLNRRENVIVLIDEAHRSQEGDLANWMIPGKLVKGMGGGMDLVASAKRVVILMTHCNKKGASKVLKKCTLPLTGPSCVDRLITECAVFDFEDGKMILKELAPDMTVEKLHEITEAEFTEAADLATMDF